MRHSLMRGETTSMKSSLRREGISMKPSLRKVEATPMKPSLRKVEATPMKPSPLVAYWEGFFGTGVDGCSDCVAVWHRNSNQASGLQEGFGNA